jgi:hypothetical protein
MSRARISSSTTQASLPDASSRMSSRNLDSLPPDIFLELIPYLPSPAFMALTEVNHKLRDMLINNDTLWNALVLRLDDKYDPSTPYVSEGVPNTPYEEMLFQILARRCQDCGHWGDEQPKWLELVDKTLCYSCSLKGEYEMIKEEEVLKRYWLSEDDLSCLGHRTKYDGDHFYYLEKDVENLANGVPILDENGYAFHIETDPAMVRKLKILMEIKRNVDEYGDGREAEDGEGDDEEIYDDDDEYEDDDDEEEEGEEDQDEEGIY